MSDDEQGYAPAAFLEPLEEGNREDVHPEGETSEGRVWCGVCVWEGVVWCVCVWEGVVCGRVWCVWEGVLCVGGCVVCGRVWHLGGYGIW